MEEAISITMRLGQTPSDALQTKLKRLLDTDRSSDRKPRSNKPELANFAFYSDKAPGSGSEVWFSSYEVFALLLALKLMEHGSTQARAVAILRRARPALEPKHTEMLRWNPDELFDNEKIRKLAQPGSLVVWSTRPVFLITASLRGPTTQAHNLEVAVVEHDELRSASERVGYPISLTELTRLSHDLHQALAKTKPSKRGKVSSSS
jgi:hypothetical protein